MRQRVGRERVGLTERAGPNALPETSLRECATMLPPSKREHIRRHRRARSALRLRRAIAGRNPGGAAEAVHGGRTGVFAIGAVFDAGRIRRGARKHRGRLLYPRSRAQGRDGQGLDPDDHDHRLARAGDRGQLHAAKARGRRQLGMQGEAAVHGAYDIGSPGAFNINGRDRMADGLTDTRLSEINNVGYLAFIQQLRDYSDYAQQTGRRFDLYTRPVTILSGPLQNAINSGRINRLDIPK